MENYEINNHLPSRVEELQTCYTSGNLDGFYRALDTIKLLLKENQGFIDGLKQDETNMNKKISKLRSDARETFNKALQHKNDIDLINDLIYLGKHLETQGILFKQELDYDILETVISTIRKTDE